MIVRKPTTSKEKRKSTRLPISTLMFLPLLLVGCTTAIEPEHGMVNWVFSNASGDRLSMIVYDKVCKRRISRISLPRTGSASVSTCNDGNDRSDIRYRRAGQLDVRNPWLDAVVAPGQSLLVRY